MQPMAMMVVLRHLLSVLLLPFVVVVVVPALVMGWPPERGGGVLGTFGVVAGGALFLTGLALFTWCLALFARIGRGTLAPWDPTRRLVAVGPYRLVRNPMISGVAGMLLGQAILFESMALAVWAAIFIVLNHVYFLVLEEPGLEKRFGAPYVLYKQQVPRWLPRVRLRRGSAGRWGG